MMATVSDTFNVGVQLPTGNQEEQHHTSEYLSLTAVLLIPSSGRSLSENGYLLEKRVSSVASRVRIEG